MPSRTVHPIAIVGAGLAGATVAYHLARRGETDVVLLEQERTPGVHSSGRNASFIREWSEERAWKPLLSEGAAFLRTGELAAYERNGSLLLGLGDEEVSRWVPPARGRARWCPEDGIVDVAGLLASYLRGRDVRYECRVLSFAPGRDHLEVETTQGRIRARILVNAAGPWAGEVGRLPLQPLNRHVFVTSHLPSVDPHWPFVWDVKSGLYFRPESGGLLLSPCDEIPAPPGDYREDPTAIETLAERVQRLQPGLGDLPIAHRWVGQRTFAKDRIPVVGFDPREPRLFHVAGLGGHGVTSSSAVGALAAAVLTGAAPGREELAPARLLPP